MGVLTDVTSYPISIPFLLFVCVKLTMSSAHRWSTGDNMSCHCLSNRSNIKRQSSQAARHNAHRTLSSLKYSPSHFLSQVHTICDKQFPRLKTFRPPKNDSYWAPYGWSHKAHCVLIPPPLPRQRVALRSKWCGDQDGFNCAPVTEYQISLPWVLLSYSSMKFSALGKWNNWQ